MKAFFIRQILPPVLVQLSIIVVLVYFEAKDFVPYVSPDEAGADFLAVLVLVPSVMLTWLWQVVQVLVVRGDDVAAAAEIVDVPNAYHAEQDGHVL